ncbi:MAG: hypothetical protein ACK4L8_12780 [Nitrincola lacisaponensis]|uniref:hypothetical protein n=1 Tax=Nitrincola lacisaponensis TaxID=267850 RepID=UPI00391D12EC
MNFNKDALSPTQRYLWTLELVYKEGNHLLYSWKRVFQDQQINLVWVKSLDKDPESAVQLEAFVSRFSRMQDSLADKLLPRWLECLAEKPGSQIENLNKAERFGVISNTEDWLMTRRLRNQLVHEYMTDTHVFLASLLEAKKKTDLLVQAYNNIRNYQPQLIFQDATTELPPELDVVIKL